MKIGVSSYSFSRLVKSGALKQIDVIAQTKELGYEAIEFSTIAVPTGLTLADFAGQLRKQAQEIGVPIVNYAIGADFINGSQGNLAAEIERVKREVDIAQLLGSPCMRHDATAGFKGPRTGPRGFDAALPRLVEGCRAVTEYAAAKNIRTCVENHGFFCQDSARCEQLANAVGHPNFGILIDMGNFLCVDEDPASAVGRLAPYAAHLHAKDFLIKSGSDTAPGEGWITTRGGNFIRGTIVAHGQVPLVACIRAMKRTGYDGIISVEFEGPEEVLPALKQARLNLSRLLDLTQ